MLKSYMKKDPYFIYTFPDLCLFIVFFICCLFAISFVPCLFLWSYTAGNRSFVSRYRYIPVYKVHKVLCTELLVPVVGQCGLYYRFLSLGSVSHIGLKGHMVYVLSALNNLIQMFTTLRQMCMVWSQVEGQGHTWPQILMALFVDVSVKRMMQNNHRETMQ